MNTIDTQTNQIIVKHNELISRARYSLSEQGIKLVSVLISMIKPDDADFQEYHFHVKDFANAINSNSKDIFAQVDKLTDELMSKPFSIGNEKFNWAYYAHYKQGEANLVLKIAPELKPYLLHLKENYCQYNIRDILSLKSSYVIRLYELIVMKWNHHIHYNPNAKSHVFEILVDDLRNLFEIPESQLYADIKRHIIDKAQKQFKDKTNLKFEYEEYKIARKVTRLKIKVSENMKGSNDPLRDLKSFISWIRKDFVNAEIYHIEGKQCLSVNVSGRLYDKYQNETIDNKRSQEIWEKLYKLALEDKLISLKQGTLFN